MKTGIIEPYYIEGKGIYVPIINKVLAMRDAYKMKFDDAIKEGIPSIKEWHIIYYFKDEINRLLKENGGEPLRDYWYWSSTPYNQECAWLVHLYDGYTNYYYHNDRNFVRAVSAFQNLCLDD